jgi:hypothetical protein
MSNYEVHEIQEAARLLYENIKADINNASTRLEHVRLTALAQEAANLVTMIDSNDGPEGSVTSNE